MRSNKNPSTHLTRTMAVLATLSAACSGPDGRDAAGFSGGGPGTSATSNDAPTSNEGTTIGGSTSPDVSTAGETSGNGETTHTDTASINTNTTSVNTNSTSSDSTGNDSGTTGEACNDLPDNLVGPEYTLGPKFAEHFAIYDLGDVPGINGLLGGSVISASDPDVLLIVGSTGFPPAQLFKIGLARGACGHITGFVGVAQAIADVPQATSVMFARDDLLLLTTHPTSQLYQLIPGENAPSYSYDFDVMKEVQHIASGISLVPASYGLSMPTLCFSSYPSGAFTCGEIKNDGPLIALSDLKQMSTYAFVGNGFAYVPDELEWPGFAPHSLIGSATPLKGIYAYRCDKNGIPIFETGEAFVNGGTHNVSIDPVAGDVLISALKAYIPPGDAQVKRLLLVRPRALIAN